MASRFTSVCFNEVQNPSSHPVISDSVIPVSLPTASTSTYSGKRLQLTALPSMFCQLQCTVSYIFLSILFNPYTLVFVVGAVFENTSVGARPHMSAAMPSYMMAARTSYNSNSGPVHSAWIGLDWKVLLYSVSYNET